MTDEKLDVFLHAMHCPICKREFFPTSLWVYRDARRTPYCSWKCLQVKHKADEEKRKAAKKAKQANRVYKKIQQVDKDGTVVAVFESAMVAADAVEGLYNCIYGAARSGEKYKGFYWRYQDEKAMPVTKPTC